MKRIVVLIATLAIGCTAAAVAPAELQLGADACAHCRMTVVSTRTAAQIVAPGEEPVIFDEIGCLRDYLASHDLSAAARIFVADHHSGEWVAAASAIFTKSTIATPMSSGLIAHASRQSRDADPAAHNGQAVDPSAVLGASRVTP